MPQVIRREHIRTWLPPRPRDCHKGDFGDVGILGGAPGMAGAALLAGRAALWLGAGRVHVGLLDERLAVDPLVPELMLAAPERLLRLALPACLAVGPGLGQGEAAHAWLEAAVASDLPLLLDADALNLVAGDAELAGRLRGRPAQTLLTPHPGEAGRLLGLATAAVQGDRPGALAALVDRYDTGVLLKGADSLIGFPDREPWRNETGNPGMAAPGMGDVLTGMIAALVAQGLDMERAAVLGAHLHGAAGDRAVADGRGPNGLTAGELARTARTVLNGWLYG
ncbi:NAD(P)H-hydrate dehydratase [Parasulfuritortus cantonensis]|uniref:ADP-dependent (S)-NAD(P)H-hydrate dehydratase n=1 Tax=Parasulfuritortus cantonensis TaxID=2528202 RepID=A0A4R1BD55_9PROT|nr:NAD(P)H-hydrate dehydratase [Parasulfuritortus cantonensis]TCJ15016.1 NAD(P)H-hydrate dehydratase [Parasulfuritortus cantonensis]